MQRLRNPQNLTKIHLRRAIRKGHATVGDYSYGAPRLRFAGAARLEVGRFCSFADNVEIFLGGNHRTDLVSTYPFSSFPALWPEAATAPDIALSSGAIRIGHDVWIGSGARILSGVTLGHGAVIGAGAVVSRDVPPYAIAAGNPAEVRRMRFDPDIVGRLLESAWWNLSDDVLKTIVQVMANGPIEDALKAIETARK